MKITVTGGLDKQIGILINRCQLLTTTASQCAYLQSQESD